MCKYFYVNDITQVIVLYCIILKVKNFQRSKV